jgi:hypothetical protein
MRVELSGYRDQMLGISVKRNSRPKRSSPDLFALEYSFWP